MHEKGLCSYPRYIHFAKISLLIKTYTDLRIGFDADRAYTGNQDPA